MGRTHIHFATGLPAQAGGEGEGNRTRTDKGNGNGSGNNAAAAAAAAAEEEEEEEEEEPGTDAGSRDAADGAAAATPDVVISGMRASASVLVWVDARRAAEEGGVRWWRSGNGVVLTEGDGRGMVGLRFVERLA